MATYTTNYNLKKPDAIDNIDVSDFNDNFNKIDTALNNLQTKDASLDTAINNLQTKDASLDTAINNLDTKGKYFKTILYMNNWSVSTYCSQTANVSGLTSGTECDGFYTEQTDNWDTNLALAEALRLITNDGKFTVYLNNGSITWNYDSTTKPTIDIPIYFKVKSNR